MALTRARKTEKVKALASKLEHSTSAIVGTFSGLTAAKDYGLRKAVRGAGGSYRVVNNKLVARAGEGTKIEAALQGLRGVTSVAYTSGDPVALAKALAGWVKDNSEFFQLQAGNCRGQGAYGGGDQGAGHDAGQGRALQQAAVPDPVSGAAAGHGDQRGGTRSGRGGQPGCGEGQVCRSGGCCGRRSGCG